MKFFGDRKANVGLAALALGVASLLAVASAQEAQQNMSQQGASQQGTGQPARAVRLSFVEGQVKLAQGNQVLAAQAVANTPLFEGMQLTTADDGKAEIQFEDGSVVRLAPDSMLTLQVLRGAGTTADAELTLNAGLAYFEFQGGGQAGQISVRFGSSVATASGFTVLRVYMDTPPGGLAVFSGNVDLQIGASAAGTAGTATNLHGGESITLNAADPSQYNVAESIEPNSWDAWNSDRDQALTAEAATQTGAPSNLGASGNPAWNDLDASGSWYDVPGQGYVWSPYEAADADFDPYGNGEWMYTPSYGYVWASGYSWGYMPYQCGAWNFYNGFGWGWAPGMGGCRTWWRSGFYGGANFGFVPTGYRPIQRPLPPRGPVGPVGPSGHRPVPVIPVNRRTAFASTSFPARNRNAQVTIAGSTVEPLRPLPSRPVYSHEGFTSESNRTGTGNTGEGARGGSPANRDSSPDSNHGSNQDSNQDSDHGPNHGSSFSGNRPAVEYGTPPSYNPSSRTTAEGDGTSAPSYTPPQRPAPENHSSPPPSYSPTPYSPPRSSSGGSEPSHPPSSSAPHPSGGGGGGGASHSSSGGGGGGGSHGGGHR